MTTHTDRKSGFGGSPAKGAQPLPTEPVQIHEDPGAAYWKEATKMAEHTDRIRQMAQEATYYADAMDGSGQMAGRIWSEVRDEHFAQLVAEDCARVADGSDFGPIPHHIGNQIRAMFSYRSTTTPIEIVPGISLKAKAELIERGIKTLEQAERMTDAELLNVPSVGRRALNAIRARYSLKD